jgi:hypothetical protein
MALQSSGVISVNNLKSEFSDTGDSSLTEFYRGGSLVPSTKEEVYFGYSYGPWSPYQYQPFAGAGSRFYASSGQWVWNNSTVSGSGAYAGKVISSGSFEYQAGSSQTGGQYAIRRRTRTFFSYTEDVDINTNVPESGEISLTDFYSAEDA